MLGHEWVQADYVAQPYSGPVTLLLAQDTGWNVDDTVTTWGRVAGEVEVQLVPGGHLTCITEHLPELANSLRRVVSRTSLPPAEAATPMLDGVQ
jgi:hypothetical protein